MEQQHVCSAEADTDEDWLLIASDSRDGLVDNDEDVCRQRDEACAMSAMYGSDFGEISPSAWLLRYDIAKGVVGEMRMKLPKDYPSCVAPELTIDIPTCANVKELLHSFLVDFSPGNEVAFTWGERFVALCRDGQQRLHEVTTRKSAERAARLGLDDAREHSSEGSG